MVAFQRDAGIAVDRICGPETIGALGRLGVEGFSAVRIGKRFELTVDVADEKTLETVRTLADEVLSNAVIEDVVGIEVVE